MKFGFIPELARRFQRYVTFTHLDEKALFDILTKAENGLITQYIQRLKMRGFDLHMEESALHVIIHYCMSHSAGANGLRTACARLMEDVLFDPQSMVSNGKKIIITKEFAEIKLGK